MIVVDASLAAKWLFDEPGSAPAHALLRRFSGQLSAPDLIGVEVRGAIVRRCNMGELTYEGAIASLDTWRDIVETGAVEQVPGTPERLDASVRLALSLGHPLKDCLYLVLATELHCPLATCDARFASRARSLYPDIRLLSDFGPG